MNRKAFIQQAILHWMPHFKSNKACIERAKIAWADLTAEGFGDTTETSRASRNWYAELQDQEEFDKCRRKFGDEGDRNKAAKAWIENVQGDDVSHDEVFQAIPRYLESIRCSGTAKAHMSTWINQRRWINYQKQEKAETKPAYNEKAQRISGLRHQISLMRDDNPMKAELQSQLDRLINSTDHSSETN